MKNILLIIFLFFSSFTVYSSAESTKIDLIFSGYRFNIPSGHAAIGSNGGSDNFLVFRYGEKLGEKYIAFTKMPAKEYIGYSCALSVFFNDSFLKNNDSSCNKDEMKAFYQVFIENNEHAHFEQNGYSVYFTIGEKDSFLFFVDPSGKVIKIDTDFLEKNELLSIVSNYFDSPL